MFSNSERHDIFFQRKEQEKAKPKEEITTDNK